MKIKPTQGRILVRPLKRNDVRHDTAEVLEVGGDFIDLSGNTRKMPVKVGDIIFCGKYSGTEVRTSEGIYSIIRDDDILAIIE